MATYHQPILKKDAQGNVIQESYTGDMKFRGEYTAGNLIYRGMARPGAETSDAAWQIAKITYSGSDVTQIDWADSSSEFNFIWDDRATYTYG